MQDSANNNPNSAAEVAFLSDTGRVRGHNEDAYGVHEAACLFVVCDGIGGAAGGEVASAIAAAAFLEVGRRAGEDFVPRQRLHDAVYAANLAVREKADRSSRLQGMGTTLVAAKVNLATREVWTVNVGDSRCYRLREGRLEQLTTDHSFVDEQVRHGDLTPAAAAVPPLRNVITRAVGTEAYVEPDVIVHDACSGDVLLLCSDGLYRELDDDMLALVLQKNRDDLKCCARALITAANQHGGNDNITVLLVRL